MNPRATIALLVVTLLVVGGLFFLRQNILPTRDRAERERYAAVFDPGDVTGIDLTRGGETVSLRRENAEWRMTAPFADRADPEAVDRLLTAVRFLEARDREAVKDPAAVPESGLASPRVRIDLRGTEPLRIDLGAEASLPGQIYARLGGEPRLLRVPDSIIELATAPAAGFRDPRLTNLVADDIEKFTVRRDDGEMTVRRERGRWMIDKPVQAPADLHAVRAFLEPLLGLRVTSFQPAATPGDATASIPGQTAAISLTPRGGGEALDLQVRRTDETNAENIPARFAPRGGAIEVDAAVLSLFDVSPESLRDRSLGYVEADTVDRIRLETGGQTFLLQRADQGWVDPASGRQFTNEAVAALIQAFNETRVVSFRTSAAPGETGLDSPSQRVVFYAWLSENTAEESAGGQILAGVKLGAADGSEAVFARAETEGETVTVPAALGNTLRDFVQPTPR